MLRPVETPTREIKKLDGLWAFSLDRENCGIDQRWWESALQESRAIAVPGSFNDQFADADIRNYVGNVWYQREVFIPKGWAGQRIVLRFDAVTHYGKVWVNNQEVMEHQGGYTPFEADVTPYVIAGKSVRITVCVNNELNWQTIPPGMVITDENGKKKQSYFHDFFNYAGIHRSVMLYTTTNTWVDDITVVTHVAQDCNHASVDWQVVANGDVSVELRDADQQVVATGQGTSGTLQVVNPHLWQPGEGYLYELCVTAKSQTECDIYPLRVGIRSVAVKDEHRLKNELRRADKPSAGAGRDIYAWVQGGLLDFNSGYYSNIIGVEGGAYYVYKLGARADMSTRWYLDGDKSFGFTLGAVKIKPSESSLLKLGRFGTDYSYGSLPYRIPLMAGSSQRTLPTVSEGALGYWALTPNIDLWGMWRSRVFLWTDSTTGIRDEGVYNSQTGKYDKHRARSFLAASWHDDTSRYSLGASVQKDVSNQIQSILEKSIPLDPNYTLKGELLGFYAQLEGLSRNTSQPNETALVSGQLTWIAPWGSVFGSGGYLRHAMNGAVVDTDIGYPFSLSLDRNREGMQSWQLGVNYRLTPQFTLTFAPIVTRGYESSKRDVRIEGAGILGGMNYRVSEGPLQGMNFFLAADKGREKRDGSALGDRLNYWDVKMSIQYDFMLK